MSRLLINGRDWRRLVAVTAGVGYKRYFSSSWDNSDAVTEPLRRSIVRNWEDRYVDDYRDPILLEQHNLHSKLIKEMLKSQGDQLLYDDFVRRIEDYAFMESMGDYSDMVMGDYSDMVMTSLSCSKGFDGLQYLDDVFTRSSWDNSDAVTEPLRRSIVRNWEDRYVDDYRDPILLEQHNLHSKLIKEMLKSQGDQILYDDFVRRIEDYAFMESMEDYSDMVMTSLSCSKGFDGLQYLDDVFTHRAADLGLPLHPGNAATLFKTGMLSDPDNGTSMVQGADVHWDEKRWEIVWFASTASTISTRASSGFCCVSSVSSDALGQIIQYAGLRNTSKIWSPNATLAIAAADPRVGSQCWRKIKCQV